MFWQYNRSLRKQLQNLSEEHAQLRVLLRALESRMDGVAALEKARGTTRETVEREDPAEEKNSPGYDPLLHLSFEKTRDLPPEGDLTLETPLQLK